MNGCKVHEEEQEMGRNDNLLKLMDFQHSLC